MEKTISAFLVSSKFFLFISSVSFINNSKPSSFEFSTSSILGKEFIINEYFDKSFISLTSAHFILLKSLSFKFTLSPKLTKILLF